MVNFLVGTGMVFYVCFQIYVIFIFYKLVFKLFDKILES